MKSNTTLCEEYPIRVLFNDDKTLAWVNLHDLCKVLGREELLTDKAGSMKHLSRIMEWTSAWRALSRSVGRVSGSIEQINQRALSGAMPESESAASISASARRAGLWQAKKRQIRLTSRTNCFIGQEFKDEDYLKSMNSYPA